MALRSLQSLLTSKLGVVGLVWWEAGVCLKQVLAGVER